jgi:hypothetical protein
VLEPEDSDLDVSEQADNEGSLSHPASLLDGAPSPWGPVAPDGGPAMVVEPMSSGAPEFDALHSPCLRACRYYHYVEAHFDHGNAPGTLARQPRQRRPMCMRQRGVFLELSADAPVLECNQWDPIDPFATVAVTWRRERYLKTHPEHDPQRMAAELEASLQTDPTSAWEEFSDEDDEDDPEKRPDGTGGTAAGN